MQDQTSQTKEIVEKLYACAKNGDAEGFGALLHEDFVAYEPPFLPYGGAYKGLDGFFGAMGEVSKYLDPSTVSIDYIQAEGAVAVARVRLQSIGGGEAIMLEETTVRDGRVAEMRIYFNDVGSMPCG